MKEKLTSCVTQQDSWELFQSIDSYDLNKFINALQSAKEFIELTMRDNFLLDQAKNILEIRGYK